MIFWMPFLGLNSLSLPKKLKYNSFLMARPDDSLYFIVKYKNDGNFIQSEIL